jgi:glycerol-3-phosphate dehydrogenase subunit B
VLAKGQGITHWTSGTIDIWNAHSGQNLYEVLHGLPEHRPDHPYNRVGVPGIESATGRFLGLMEASRYPYTGTMEHNTLLPTALGALRPTAYMPATMAAGDVSRDGEILIAGFHELRDFFPPMAASNLRAQGVNARGAYLELPTSARRREYTPRTFAFAFDDPAFRKSIGEQLGKLRGNATRIGLPAVLGLKDPMGALEDLQEKSGAQIFEIPTLPPSIPGMRLFNIFQNAIIKAGGRFQMGSEVVRGAGENGSLVSIYSEAAARQQEHRAKAFLLATGGIAGGGVRTDYTANIRDTALGLPLRAPASHDEWFASRFLHNDGHPIFRTGVATDERFRPIDEHGNVVYGNVVVAGSALINGDPVQDRCITGLAVATGWHAGHLLAEMVGSMG